MADDCPICLQTIILPIAPTCGHHFCFLCLKGACADQPLPQCPVCRRDVDDKIFKRPKMNGLSLTMQAPPEPAQQNDPPQSKVVVGDKEIKSEPLDEDDVKPPVAKKVKEEPLDEEDEAQKPLAARPSDQYYLYSARNGWWRFNPRDEEDIIAAKSRGEQNTELVIAGHTYVLDFTTMKQHRKDNAALKRDIKEVTAQEMSQLRVKGICGMGVG